MSYDRMVHTLARFRADESGSPAVEYSLVACGVAVAVAATIWNLGAEVKATLYDKLVSMF